MLINQKFNIFIFVETWLNARVLDFSILEDTHYTILRLDRANTKGGGICVLINKNLNYIEINKLHTKIVEILVFELIDPSNSDKIRVIVIYRPPKNVNENDSLKFIDLLTQYVGVPYTVLICGDLNFPNIPWDNKITNAPLQKSESLFSEFLRQNEMVQKVRHPTRNSKILDLLITNRRKAITDINTLPPFGNGLHISDHESIKFSLRFKPPIPCNNDQKIKN